MSIDFTKPIRPVSGSRFVTARYIGKLEGVSYAAYILAVMAKNDNVEKTYNISLDTGEFENVPKKKKKMFKILVASDPSVMWWGIFKTEQELKEYLNRYSFFKQMSVIEEIEVEEP